MAQRPLFNLLLFPYPVTFIVAQFVVAVAEESGFDFPRRISYAHSVYCAFPGGSRLRHIIPLPFARYAS